ncbi:DinB family protein [Rathayibacter soli]|uniref:DinB family protein n=1 Tax=Rathayibacter soli TaxID=3144168 RepID=UPI0027E56B72|nr:DinB family protein [Glaciibacter superstes]
MKRIDPGPQADERTSLIEYLNYQRATVLMKTADLSREQLCRRHPPSELTLAGLLKHLWLVEDSWITDRFLGQSELEPWNSAPFDGDPDWEMHSALDDDPDWLRASYADACARNDALIAGHGLDDLAVRKLRNGDDWTLRWVLLHLIEETARHAGHADLLREAIDGAVGE